MAIAPVVVDLLVRGMPAVQQAFKGVHDAAARAQRQMQADAEKAEKARIAAANREAKAKIAAYKVADRAESQAIAHGLREAERYERERQRIRDRSATMAGKFAAQQAAEERRANERSLKDTERTERERQRIRERSASMAGKFAAKQAAEGRAARDERINRATNIVGAGGAAVMRGMQRAGGIAAGLATTTMQLGGGFSIADSVERELGARKTAADLAASTMGEGKLSSEQILSRAKGAAVSNVMETEDVLAGIAKFKDLTGNTDRATQIVPELAKLANAFGGNVAELAENAGNIAMSNESLSNADVMRLLRVQTVQGAVGAVEMKDMARYGGRLTAGASLFGGDAATNVASMGAFAQIARQKGGAASPAEAAMAAHAFAKDVQKRAGDLEAMGIKVRDGKGGMRDPREIARAMIEKSGGDVTKLTQFGLGERGIKVLTGLSAISRQAGGGEKGLKAVDAELEKYTQGVSDQEVDARAGARLAESDKQFAKAMMELRQVAGEQLLPEFIKMIPAIRDLVPPLVEAARLGIPAFRELVEFVAGFAKAHKGLIQDIAAHPVGSLIALELTKSFAAAALPSLLKSLVSGIFSGAGGAPGAAGGAGAAGGVGAALGAGAAAGALTYALAKPGVDALLAGQASGQYKTGQLTAMLKNGSPGEKQAALESIQKMQDRYGGASGLLAQYAGASTSAVGAIYSAATGEKNFGAEQLKDATAAREILNNKDLQAAIAQAVAGGLKDGGVGGPQHNSGPNGAGRSEPIMNR